MTDRPHPLAVCDGLDKGQALRAAQEERRGKHNPGQEDSDAPQHQKGGADGAAAAPLRSWKGFRRPGQKLCPMLT